MATKTMYFSRTGNYTTQSVNDCVDFTPTASVSFGSSYKVTYANVTVDSYLVSGTSSGRYCDVAIELYSGSTWYRIYTGNVYMSGSASSGGYAFGNIAIPSSYQQTLATNGVSDIRICQAGEFSIRGKDGASGSVVFTYESNKYLNKPTNVKMTQNKNKVTVSWTAPTYGGGSGGLSYSVDITDQNGDTDEVKETTSTSATFDIQSEYYGNEISTQVYAFYSGLTSWSSVVRLTISHWVNTPTISSVTEVSGKYRVKWAAVSGSSSVTYKVTWGPNNTVVSAGSSTQLDIAIPDSYRGTSVSFKVTATSGGKTATSAAKTFTAPVLEVYNVSYGVSGAWKQCEVYYGSGGQWVKSEVSYGSGGQWV